MAINEITDNVGSNDIYPEAPAAGSSDGRPPKPSTPPPDGWEYTWDDNQKNWIWSPIGNNVPPPAAGAPDPITTPGKPPSEPAPGYNWSWDGSQWNYAPNASTTPSRPPSGVTTGGGTNFGGNRTPASLYDAPPAFSYPDFAPRTRFNAPPAFNYPDYQPISGEDVLKQDSGYKFRADAAQRALTNNASAEGLLKNAGTLKGMVDYMGGLASQEFGNADARNYRNWQGGLGKAEYANDSAWRNALTSYTVPYGQETDTYDRNLSKAEAQYGFGLDVAAGKAGGLQGAGNLNLGYGNLALGNRGLDANTLLSLYQISTRNLPTYSPLVTP